jgi:HAMP domain-containing protein
MADSLAEAAARLEAAVERLAEAAKAVKAQRPPAGVPSEDVAELSKRLVATIARLRAAMPEGAEFPDTGELPAGDDEGLPEQGGQHDVPRRAEEG